MEYLKFCDAISDHPLAFKFALQLVVFLMYFNTLLANHPSLLSYSKTIPCFISNPKWDVCATSSMRTRAYVLFFDPQVITSERLCVYLCTYQLSACYPNTPPQVDTNPISVMCFWCLKRVNGFVNTSAVCSGSRHSSIARTSSLTRSLMRCHRMAMCLDHWWNCGFFAIAIDPLLLPLMVVGWVCT